MRQVDDNGADSKSRVAESSVAPLKVLVCQQILMLRYIYILVGGFNPSISQNGNLPQIGVKSKKWLKPPPSIYCILLHIYLF